MARGRTLTLVAYERAWDEKLAFRDALRADAALADAYAAEKRRVADAVAWDKAAYSDAKGPFIASVLRRIGLIAPPHAMPTQRDH